MELPAEQIEQVIDAFADNASIDSVAKKTNLTADQVRGLLDDGDIGRRALRRKRGKLGAIFYGQVWDKLVEVAVGDNAAQTVRAVQLLREMGFGGEAPNTQPDPADNAEDDFDPEDLIGELEVE